MKRFKFRFFVKRSKRMMSVCDVDRCDHLDLDHFDIASAILGEEEGVIPMQWTGLKDVNGVDIYEGDIIACVKDKFGPGRNEYWEVVYGYFGDAAFYVSNQVNSGRLIDDESGAWGFTSSGTDRIDLEVIGNIYENPEIVK